MRTQLTSFRQQISNWHWPHADSLTAVIALLTARIPAAAAVRASSLLQQFQHRLPYIRADNLLLNELRNQHLACKQIG